MTTNTQFIIFVNFFIAVATSLRVPTKIVAGAFWKELPDSIIYEATIPLTYTATWNAELPRTSNLVTKNCSDMKTPLWCPATRALSSINEEFENQFKLIQKSLNPNLFLDDENSTHRSKRALDFIGNFFNWCCGVATEEKLKSLAISGHLFKEKMDILTRGVHSQFTVLAQQNERFAEFDKVLHDSIDKINSNSHNYEVILKQFSLKAAALESMEDHFNLLAINSYQNLRRLANTLQLFRNNEILNACKNHLVPTAILPPNILKHDLIKLDIEIKKYNHTLVIPINELSRYYKIAIADCSIAGDKIIVHVKIPIKHLNREWKLLELLTTPFSWNSETCVIMHDTMYLAVSDRIMRPISGAGLHQCKPYHDKLCFLSRFASDVKYGPQCAFKMYTGATVTELSKHCNYRCHPSDATLISEVKDDTYIITHIKNETYIICDGEKQNFPESVYNKPGAIQIELPCNCMLYANEEVMIPSRFPCENLKSKLKLNHVLPIMWSTLKSFEFHPLKTDHYPIFSNLSECINNNWTISVPHLNLTTFSDNLNTEEFEESLFSDYAQFAPHSDTLFLIWNVILSIIIFLLWKNRNANLGAQLVNTIPVVRAETGILEIYGTLPFITAAFGLISILLISIQAYKYFKIKCQKQTDSENEAISLNFVNNADTAILLLPDGRKFEVNVIPNADIEL